MSVTNPCSVQSGRETHVFIVDNNPCTILLNINTVSGANPSLPENTINPSKVHLLLSRHVDPGVLSCLDRTVIVSIFRLLKTQLLGVTQTLTLCSLLLCTLGHELHSGLLELLLGKGKVVGLLTVQDSENNDVVVHDLVGVGGGKLGDNGEPDGLHPVKDAAVVTHVVGSQSIVVGWLALTDNHQLGPGKDTESGRHEGVLGLVDGSVADEVQGEAVESSKVLGNGGMVVEVNESNLHVTLLLQSLEFLVGDLLDARVDGLTRVADEITHAAETIVLNTLTVLEVENGGVTLDLEVLAQALLSLAVNLTNVKLSLHFFSKLSPSRSHCLTVSTPGSVELDEPGIAGGSDQLSETLGVQRKRFASRVGGGSDCGNGLLLGLVNLVGLDLIDLLVDECGKSLEGPLGLLEAVHLLSILEHVKPGPADNTKLRTSISVCKTVQISKVQRVSLGVGGAEIGRNGSSRVVVNYFLPGRGDGETVRALRRVMFNDPDVA
jgi:hypothetical protein